MELLERTSQLDELHGLLRRARGGSGCLVAIGGEAGAGKSSLVNRFAATARQSAEVMIGTCDPLTAPRPLGPLFDIASALSPPAMTHPCWNRRWTAWRRSRPFPSRPPSTSIGDMTSLGLRPGWPNRD